jgi:hypothetical protein
MNKQDLSQIQQAAERMTAALEALEQAIDEGNHRKIGARLYELTKTIQALQALLQELKP